MVKVLNMMYYKLMKVCENVERFSFEKAKNEKMEDTIKRLASQM